MLSGHAVSANFARSSDLEVKEQWLFIISSQVDLSKCLPASYPFHICTEVSQNRQTFDWLKAVSSRVPVLCPRLGL